MAEPLYESAADYRLARNQADREMFLKGIGALADTERGASVADVTRAYAPSWEGRGMPEADRLAARQALLGQLADLDKADVEATTKREESAASMRKAGLDVLNHFIDYSGDVTTQTIRSTGDVERQKVAEYGGLVKDSLTAARDYEGATDLGDYEAKLAQLVAKYEPDMGEIDPTTGTISWNGPGGVPAAQGFAKEFKGLLADMPPAKRAEAAMYMDEQLGFFDPANGGGNYGFRHMGEAGQGANGPEVGTDQNGNPVHAPGSRQLGLLTSSDPATFGEIQQLIGSGWNEHNELKAKWEEATSRARGQEDYLKKRGVRAPGLDQLSQTLGLAVSLVSGEPISPQSADLMAQAGASPDAIGTLLGGGGSESSMQGGSSRLPGEAEAAAIDPNSARGRILTLLDELDSPNPSPPTLVKKLEIMNSPQFEEFMAQNGLQDPDVAWRALMSRTRQQQGAMRRADRRQLQGIPGGAAQTGVPSEQPASVPAGAAAASPLPANAAPQVSTAQPIGAVGKGALETARDGGIDSTLAGIDKARRGALAGVLSGATEAMQARSLADLPTGRVPEEDPEYKRTRAAWLATQLKGE